MVATLVSALTLASSVSADPIEWRDSWALDFTFTVERIVINVEEGSPPAFPVSVGDMFGAVLMWDSFTADPNDAIRPFALLIDPLPWCRFCGSELSAMFVNIAITGTHVDFVELFVDVGNDGPSILGDGRFGIKDTWFIDGGTGSIGVLGTREVSDVRRVPEPSTLLLFGSGVGALIPRRGKRTKGNLSKV
jgi:hypothetical protein